MKLSLLFLFTLLLPLTTTQAPPPRNDLTCSLCKTVMELLDQYITDTTNEEAIADALKEICALLPAPLDAECDAMISEYTDDIIELLVNEYLSPQQVCDQLTLCP
eukprot:TRINITY_DN21764_c0_g1_i1.p2 TRINITY_DN21764_c0_g1~~TRINITY_DN21764_c0_g1_i1.p2  ORF type:complete len:105 (-),score=34.13 TRINITY_DN21764_c0_g1_i1:56-370(-)